MSAADLALAAFAAETGAHVVREPKERRFERFRRTFDAGAFLASLSEQGLRFVGRSQKAVIARPPVVSDDPEVGDPNVARKTQSSPLIEVAVLGHPPRSRAVGSL